MQIFHRSSAKYIFLILTGLNLMGLRTYAQTEDQPDNTNDVDQIEAELESKTKKETFPDVNPPETESKLENFSGLGKLAPFSEISVLQKRYLPKTKRMQFFGGITNVVNDPWFFGIGFNGRFAYHLTEAWAIEASGIFLTNTERQATKDLKSEHSVNADSIITPKNYLGAAIVWTPIYGKITYGNRRILPFDMYFSLGGGSTSVDGGTGGGTLSVGTGQIYAFSKSMGFRWDFSWNNFSAKPKLGESQAFNNLLLTFGASFFFPEAKYR